MEMYKSRAKVKAVALANFLMTAAILAQIFGCAVYPLWVDYSESAVAAAAKLPKPVTTRRPPTTPRVLTDLERRAQPLFTMPDPMIEDGWLWTFTGLYGMLGLCALFAIVALIRSASPKFDNVSARNWISIWMYCDILTILLAAVEFIFVLSTPVFGIQLMPPIPTLLFVGFRAVLFCVILQEMNLMAPTVVPTLDMAMLEARRLRALQKLELGSKAPPSPPQRSLPRAIPIVNCQCLTPDSSV